MFLDAPLPHRFNTPLLDGQIAQSVEQWIENPRVGGSIPPLATNRSIEGFITACSASHILCGSWTSRQCSGQKSVRNTLIAKMVFIAFKKQFPRTSETPTPGPEL